MTTITISGTNRAVKVSVCPRCRVKIFPPSALRDHEKQHTDTGARTCPKGHDYNAFDVGKWKTCPTCRSLKSKRAQARTGRKWE